MNTKEILTFTVNVGSLMLSSGAEIYRVKETIVHILNGLAVEEFDVYVVSNGIFASAHENREDACSVIRNITKAEMHSGKISAINQLSRDIYNHDCDFEEAKERFAQIEKIPRTKYKYLLLMASIQKANGLILFCSYFTSRASNIIFISSRFLLLREKKK